MKKFLTSVLAIGLVMPAMAENITNASTCNTGVLGQSDNNSTANVEANWNANTININWYNGDTRILQNTCTYDGQITLPAEPTKPGYTFAGWRLRATPAIPTSCSEITNQSDCEAFTYNVNCDDAGYPGIGQTSTHCSWGQEVLGVTPIGCYAPNPQSVCSNGGTGK